MISVHLTNGSHQKSNFDAFTRLGQLPIYSLIIAMVRSCIIVRGVCLDSSTCHCRPREMHIARPSTNAMTLSAEIPQGMSTGL